MKRWVAFMFVLTALVALALRVPQMERRPMHNDEAVNALKLQELWEKGSYRYDPDEYHGPVLYYATLPAVWLSGARDFPHLTERTLRVVPVVFGVAMILLFWLLADGLGRAATLFAGGLAAISPAMVFYSRYFIHEMLLACFTLLLLAAGWRYTRSRHPGWAVLGGAALGLMYATKETFVIPLGAVTGATIVTVIWSGRPLLKGLWNWKHALMAVVAAALVAVVFFTSFFSHPSGLLDAVGTYLPWLRRAGGASPHVHPWYFYLQRLFWYHPGRGPVWSEGVILVLAIIGVVAAVRAKGLADAQVACVRFIACYAVLLTVAYSAISYKTPWCLLGFLQGLILLAGVGAAVVLRWQTRRWLQAAVGAALVAGAGQLMWETWETSYLEPAGRRNPYAYAQTSPDILELVEKVQAVAQVDPRGDEMLIKVMAPGGDYWPLPWYLRQFKQVGWWDNLQRDPLAPVMIVGAQFEEGLGDAAEATHPMTGIYSLRSRVFLGLHVEIELWNKFMEAKESKKGG
jgi:uncharacterized protein (TIGR03663 family)